MMLASFDINTTSVSSGAGIDSSSIAPGFTPVCREVRVARSSYFREISCYGLCWKKTYKRYLEKHICLEYGEIHIFLA